jgi:hypothetical protein
MISVWNTTFEIDCKSESNFLLISQVEFLEVPEFNHEIIEDFYVFQFICFFGSLRQKVFKDELNKSNKLFPKIE